MSEHRSGCAQPRWLAIGVACEPGPWIARPLCWKVEPGLILASGHYRNGVLLTPATAEWVATALEQP